MRREERLIREYVRLSVNERKQINEAWQALIEPLVAAVAPTVIDKVMKSPGTALKWIMTFNTATWPALFALWAIKKKTGFNAEEEINKLGGNVSDQDKKALLDAAKSAAAGKVDKASVRAAQKEISEKQ